MKQGGLSDSGICHHVMQLKTTALSFKSFTQLCDLTERKMTLNICIINILKKKSIY